MKVEYKLITDGEKFAVLRIERGWLKAAQWFIWISVRDLFV